MDPEQSKNVDRPEKVEGESGEVEETVEENIGKNAEEHLGEIAEENVGEIAEENLETTAEENLGKTGEENLGETIGETLKETPSEVLKQDVVPEESANEKKENESDKDDSEENDSSEDSEDSSDITKEMEDMYDESEEEEEVEEEENKTDLSEYKKPLESTYITSIHWDGEYLDKVNKSIEQVSEQLYAIEIYINDLRTFFGYSCHHWVRIKAFDFPCFEIHPCRKVQTHASLYANRSKDESKESTTSEISEIKKKSNIGERKSSNQEIRKNNKLQRPVTDWSTTNEKKRQETMDGLIREEFTQAKTAIWSESNLKVESEQEFVEKNFTSEDVGSVLCDEMPQGLWKVNEPFENGKTIMFPMRPQQLIYQIQRQPLKIFVQSSSGRQCWASLNLAGLAEAVIRAAKGPPYPISSSQKFNITAKGGFVTKIKGSIKIIAMGREYVSQVKCEDNPNEQGNHHFHRKNITEINKNTDCQDKPAILTGPEEATLYDIVKNIRAREPPRKCTLPPEPKQWEYYVEDLIFDRKANTVVRAPKKTFQTLRAEIDRYLVLNRSRREIPELSEDSKDEWRKEECTESGVEEEGDLGEELEEEEEEEMEVDLDNNIVTSTQGIWKPDSGLQ